MFIACNIIFKIVFLVKKKDKVSARLITPVLQTSMTLLFIPLILEIKPI